MYRAIGNWERVAGHDDLKLALGIVQRAISPFLIRHAGLRVGAGVRTGVITLIQQLARPSERPGAILGSSPGGTPEPVEWPRPAPGTGVGATPGAVFPERHAGVTVVSSDDGAQPLRIGNYKANLTPPIPEKPVENL